MSKFSSFDTAGQPDLARIFLQDSIHGALTVWIPVEVAGLACFVSYCALRELHSTCRGMCVSRGDSSMSGEVIQGGCDGWRNTLREGERAHDPFFMNHI